MSVFKPFNTQYNEKINNLFCQDSGKKIKSIVF